MSNLGAVGIRLIVVIYLTVSFKTVNMSNANIDSVFSEYVLKAIQGIRNSKRRPDNHIIFDYVTKIFAANADASLIDTPTQILLSNNLTENRSTNKGDSFFVKHTSSDFHEANYKRKTNNIETLAQATQTSVLMNHSYVSNDVFCLDYIEFKKYVDDIINSLNAKNEVLEKSGRNIDQSKLKYLEAEILKLRKENTSLKDNNKSKLKIIESFATCQRKCTIINYEKLHVKPLSYKNRQTRNNWK